MLPITIFIDKLYYKKFVCLIIKLICNLKTYELPLINRSKNNNNNNHLNIKLPRLKIKIFVPNRNTNTTMKGGMMMNNKVKMDCIFVFSS